MSFVPPPALREALAIRVQRYLPRAIWQDVFGPGGSRDVAFEQHVLTLLHADPGQRLPPEAALLLQGGLRGLAAQHEGKSDHSAAPSSLVLFRHPLRALRMALALQHRVPETRFRAGLRTGLCTLGIFEAQQRHWVVVLGPEREEAAALAWNAAPGAVSVCPASRQALAGMLKHEAGDAVITHTYDGFALVRATLTTVDPRLAPA